MSKKQNKKTGQRGEELAGELLGRKEYEIVNKNYQNKWGEVDIVAKQKINNEEWVVFVEVKTKKGEQFGEPWEMIDTRKLKRVENMGYLWCEEFDWKGLCRVDVVGVWLDERGELKQIKHWENVQL